jgi:hypothetical protein
MIPAFAANVPEDITEMAELAFLKVNPLDVFNGCDVMLLLSGFSEFPSFQLMPTLFSEICVKMNCFPHPDVSNHKNRVKYPPLYFTPT